MSTKSTPGPWTVNIAGHYAQSHEVIGDNGNQLVALIYAGTKEAKEANAKLIAAAPELLNVLIDARELLKDWGIDEEAAGHALLYKIESAIKKATA